MKKCLARLDKDSKREVWELAVVFEMLSLSPFAQMKEGV